MKKEQILKEIKELKETGLVEVSFSGSVGWLTVGNISGCYITTPTGATTVKKVILNIYDNDKLESVVEKIKVAKKELSELREVIKYRQQSPVLFEYLKNNIELV